jgi:hypothetical protein
MRNSREILVKEFKGRRKRWRIILVNYSIMFLYRLTQHTEYAIPKVIYLFTIITCFEHLSVIDIDIDIANMGPYR